MTEHAAKKKRSNSRPTQRTRERCNELGWTSAIVEKFVRFPPPGHRVDLFGFIDVLALAPGVTYAIQTTASAVADRQAKILDGERRHALTAVLAAGWRVEVWGWRKTNDRTVGARKLWRLRRTQLNPETLAWIDLES